MKIRSIQSGDQKWLHIRHFGMEEIAKNAKWGPCARDVYILHYVLTGKGYFNCAPVEANQGFLIRQNELAEYHYDESEPWQYFWVIFEGSLAAEICQKYINVDDNGIFRYPFGDQLTQIMMQLFSSSEYLSQAEGLSVFFHLLSLHEQKTSRNDNHYVSDAKNYMYMNIHQPLSVADVAMELGISDRYLYNLFIRYEGIAPKKYMNALRVQNAKALLKNSRYTVTEIAAAVGFYDVLPFSRFFSKFVGMSPSAYRRS